MNSGLHTFLIRVHFIGPYLPLFTHIVENYKLINDKDATNHIWEIGPDGLSVDVPDHECLISLKYDVKAKNASDLLFRVRLSSTSSMEALEKAKEYIDNLCSLLSISIIGNRYYYKVDGVHIISDTTAKSNTETPPSEPILGVSYEKHPIQEAQVKFIEEVGNLLQEDSTLNQVIKYFGKASEAEFYHSILDEKSILFYYKCIELISGKFAKKRHITPSNKSEKQDGLIKSLISNLSTEPKLNKRIEILRLSFSEMKRLDGSIISENIKETGKLIGFNEKEIQKLESLIGIRNEIVIHPRDQGIEIILDDERDFREFAKKFIRSYIKLFHNIDTSDIEKITEIKAIGGWYKATATKSSA